MVKSISGTTTLSELSVTETDPTNDTSVVNVGYLENNINSVLDWKESCLDKDLTAPPGVPVINSRYIVGFPSTGSWAGKENNIAQWDGSSWVFDTPDKGSAIYVEDESSIYLFDVVWAILSTGTSDHSLLTNIQGGTTSEYFHFTNTEHTNLLSVVANSVSNLTSGEVTQLSNLGTNTISEAQWNFLSDLDQNVETTANPTFDALTVTNIIHADAIHLGANNAEISHIAEDSVLQIYGGHANGGTSMRLYGPDHANQPNRIDMRANDFRISNVANNQVMQFDNNNSRFEFKVLVRMDNITEDTNNAGVTIEGILLQDGLIDGIDLSTVQIFNQSLNTTDIVSFAQVTVDNILLNTNTINATTGDLVLASTSGEISFSDPLRFSPGTSDIFFGLETDVSATRIDRDGTKLVFASDLMHEFRTNTNIVQLEITSAGVNLKLGRTYSIDDTEILSDTTLASSVVNSGLTNVGTLTELQVDNINLNGNIISSTTGDLTISSTGDVIFTAPIRFLPDTPDLLFGNGIVRIDYDNAGNRMIHNVDTGDVFQFRVNNLIEYEWSSNEFNIHGNDITGVSLIGGEAGRNIVLNAATGQTIEFEVNGTAIMAIDSTKVIFPQQVSFIGTYGLANPAADPALYIDSVTGAIEISISSRKYKTNIREYKFDYNKIYELRPVIYDLKEEFDKTKKGKNMVGLIAEEIESEGFGEFCRWKDGSVDSINYNLLVVPLIGVVKEQKKTINSLEKRVIELEKKCETYDITSLLLRMKVLEASIELLKRS